MTATEAARRQQEGAVYLTDSGLETDMIFNQGFDLPEFAAFTMLNDERGAAALFAYYADHVDAARDAGLAIILETPTWRASPSWAELLGVGPAALADANRRGVALLEEVRTGVDEASDVVISGNIGPRGDGYRPEALMGVQQAADYHQFQADIFAACEVDRVTAMTLNYVDEATGVALAAERSGVAAVLSFTVETDGVLPDGTPLGEAIDAVDNATGGYASYYMVNCAHPTHFEHVLDPSGSWIERLGGIRANASRMSHAELDESTELDIGDPVQLADDYAALNARFPQLSVFGGCCGTDIRHARLIAQAVAQA